MLCAVILFLFITFVVHKIPGSKEMQMLKGAGYYHPVSFGDYSLNVYDYGN